MITRDVRSHNIPMTSASNSSDKPAITLSIAHAPSEIPAPARRARTVAIVVDVIRATTTLAVMLDRGVRRVWVARDVDAARAVRATLPSALLAGEVAAVAPPDFDCGNSPAEWGALPDSVIAGREVLFSTTNGARALHACRSDAAHGADGAGGAIFAGSLCNATAVSQAALTAARDLAADSDSSDSAAEILVVCSGRDGLPAEDDSLCAAWLIATLRILAERAEGAVVLNDAASAALDLLAPLVSARRIQVDAGRWLYERLRASKPARDVLDVDLGEDIVWCANLDASRAVPVVTGYDAARDLLIVEGA